MTRKTVVTFLIWTAVLNSPPMLVYLPLGILRVATFVLVVLWINIPAILFGIAPAAGMHHFDTQMFGSSPLTPLSWTLLIVFWMFVAAGLTWASWWYSTRKSRARIASGSSSRQ